MKRMMIAAALALLPGAADAGERAVVPGWQWVTIQRCPDGVWWRSLMGALELAEDCERGGRCGIEIGGVVSEIGRHGDRVLVRYDARSGDRNGTPCDGGEVFWLAAGDFATMTERYKAVIEEAIENSNIVDRLLKDER